ncbi:hypothetical protein [Kitasatospora sp. NPDC085879]|uniref:hypothetical protein n=1 Tax=Kitasatospora sp. NPDC085879 TaxID=3154769 RepID=UPI003413EDAB
MSGPRCSIRRHSRRGGFAAALPRLRVLDGCGPVDSLTPLTGHPVLREVYVTGSTVIADGDLRPLFDPALTVVAVERGAPHYSHRPADVRRG